MGKTNFIDGTTAVVAEWLNKVFSHVHDGVDEDGHAPKVDLADHIDYQGDEGDDAGRLEVTKDDEESWHEISHTYIGEEGGKARLVSDVVKATDYHQVPQIRSDSGVVEFRTVEDDGYRSIRALQIFATLKAEVLALEVTDLGADISGSTTINGNTTINELLTVNDDLTVTGDTTLEGLSASADVSVGGGLDVEGRATSPHFARAWAILTNKDIPDEGIIQSSAFESAFEQIGFTAIEHFDGGSGDHYYRVYLDDEPDGHPCVQAELLFDHPDGDDDATFDDDIKVSLDLIAAGEIHLRIVDSNGDTVPPPAATGGREFWWALTVHWLKDEA